jgi:hypothetical protein
MTGKNSGETLQNMQHKLFCSLSKLMYTCETACEKQFVSRNLFNIDFCETRDETSLAWNLSVEWVDVRTSTLVWRDLLDFMKKYDKIAEESV